TDYFEGAKLKHAKLHRIDGMIDFQWKGDSPFPKGSQESVDHLELDVAAGDYSVRWLDPVSGRSLKREAIKHTGGVRRFDAPIYSGEVALAIMRGSN